MTDFLYIKKDFKELLTCQRQGGCDMRHILGGYYIISSSERPEYLDKEVIPELIYSASECLCDIHPDINILWASSKKSKKEYSEKLRISENTYYHLEAEVEEMFELGEITYPNLFTTVAVARKYKQKYLSNLQNTKIFGIGLPEGLVHEFIAEEESETKPEENQYVLEKKLLNKNLMSKADCKMLGYEILGFESGKFHSYLCNGLEKDFKENFRFTLNENGFISSLEEAISYCHYCNDEEVETEPVLWLPWAIYEYR